MLGEEVERATVRGGRITLVVVLASITREGVVASGIGVQTEVRRSELRLHLCLAVLRDEAVLLRYVEQRRLLRLARLAEIIVDADAVVADSCVDIGARRSEIGEQTAEAV